MAPLVTALIEEGFAASVMITVLYYAALISYLIVGVGFGAFFALNAWYNR